MAKAFYFYKETTAFSQLNQKRKRGKVMKLARLKRQNGTGWSPLEQLDTLQEEINRLFESPLGELSGKETALFNGWAPAVDLYEDKDNFVLKTEVPGMKKEEIEVSLHQDMVILSGERKLDTPEGAEISRSERFAGRFQRSLTLPKPVDGGKVKASYKDGILTVTLPKTEESKPRQIEVKIR
jgi:HSP20 family protein